MAATTGVLTAERIAELSGAELIGEGGSVIEGVAPIDDAGPTDLTFARDPSFARKLATSDAGAAFVPRELSGEVDRGATSLLLVDDADLALATLLGALAESLPKPKPGVHETAVIDPDASVDPSASVGPHCSVGPGSSVGPRTVLRAGVVIEHGCSLGADCVVGPGVVIGSDGFGYLPNPVSTGPGDALVRVPHVGGVEIGDHVEIGANTTIDRGKLGPTRIGVGTKIDNLVQIGHNCRIGACCILCGRVGLSGSVTLGDGVQLAGGVGIADNRTVGAGSKIGAGSGVKDDIPGGVEYVGYPAIPSREFFRRYAFVTKLMKKRDASKAGG
ncbi:MAG: UDP-3-O-(3-hydroxymyristoyl)glucosamine N-acyltransferase [Planctomycetota bacterium]